MIDIEEIRRSYGVVGESGAMKKSPELQEETVSERMKSSRRLIGKQQKKTERNSRRYPVGGVSWLLRPVQRWLINRYRNAVQNSPRPPAGKRLNLLGSDPRTMGNNRSTTVQNSRRPPAGTLSWLLKLGQRWLSNRPRKIVQNSPTRTLLPRLIVLPWWMVITVLVTIAIVSVTYSVGEEHQVIQENSQENQDVDAMEFQDEVSEEASLVKQLQDRLKELQEREQRLQQKQANVEGLQRDLEALAARQAKEAERLKKRAAELDGKKIQEPKDDSSLAHLVKVYNAMDPEEAALRIEKMEKQLALEILSGIKEKKAAVVLAGVNPEKAAMLSQGLRNFKK